MSWPTLKSSCSSRHVPVQRFAAQSALKSLLGGGLMLIAAQVVGGDDMQPKVKVDDSSFKCITEMTPVRHFYVDNLLGNLTETVAIAHVGKGEYPEGSVPQLMPNEVMIKQQKGFNPITRNWEFFFIRPPRRVPRSTNVASRKSITASVKTASRAMLRQGLNSTSYASKTTAAIHSVTRAIFRGTATDRSSARKTVLPVRKTQKRSSSSGRS